MGSGFRGNSELRVLMFTEKGLQGHVPRDLAEVGLS